MTPFDNTMLHSLWAYGWFTRIIGVEEDRVTVTCEMFSRDYDDETGFTDILMLDVSEFSLLTYGDKQMYVRGPHDGWDGNRCVCCNAPHPNDAVPGAQLRAGSARIPCPTGCGNLTNSWALRSVAKFHGVFELRDGAPAVLLKEPLPVSWGFKEMLPEMEDAIGAILLAPRFPEAEAFLQADAERGRNYWDALATSDELDYPADVEWGYQEPEDEVPPPNFDDMAPPAPCSALDAEEAEAEANRPTDGTWPCYADASWGRCACCFANLEELDKLYGILETTA